MVCCRVQNVTKIIFYFYYYRFLKNVTKLVNNFLRSTMHRKQKFYIYAGCFRAMKNLKLLLNIHVLKSKLHNLTYHKILLISPGFIYGQRTNLMGLYSGEGMGRAYIQEENTSTCNLLNLFFFLSFFQYKARI